MDSNKQFQDQQFKEPTKATEGGKLHDLSEGIKAKFQAHSANPGPVIPQNIGDIPQEGTKEERMAKTQELNK
ncbi:hypothetical protein B0T19DRAFT_407154 [Cercophora scortea]|uniref:Uncharacterized protein n=1 Tax=Cercophora scortea TaxID=314031 RepID=A0AAE0J371_9PEZI|nr:hypothetical protein B0T19DRAFT_407154 [Cercophora scortea]